MHGKVKNQRGSLWHNTAGEAIPRNSPRHRLLCRLPLNTDSHGETDGATDGDVVERVEQCGEHQGVHSAVNRNRPGEH